MAVCSQSAISGSPQACSGNAGVRPKPGRSRYGELNHCRQTPCRASSANDGPHPCHARTRRAIHHHCPQSRSTAAIAPCVPLLQPGTNRLSHNSGSSSLGVGAIPTAILGFEGLICADVMKREDLSQSRVMTQPPFRWICHAVMMMPSRNTANPACCIGQPVTVSHDTEILEAQWDNRCGTAERRSHGAGALIAAVILVVAALIAA